MTIDVYCFPNLEHDYEPSSPPTPTYNCLAFAAGVEDEWWEPGLEWPRDLSEKDFSIKALVAMYERKGFILCSDAGFEAGTEKIALYGGTNDEDDYTHAAKQLPDGRWASKLGKGEDIIHQHPESVAGGLYGELRYFMKRIRKSQV